MDHLLINAIGYTGSALLIMAFLLNCMQKLDSASRGYQWMNLLGAGMTLSNAWVFGALPSAAVSLFWVLVSAWFLVKIYQAPAAA